MAARAKVLRRSELRTLADRFCYAMQVRGVSGQSLEQKPHQKPPDESLLPRGYASLIANSKRKRLAPEMVLKAARLLNISYEWLAVGTGPMGPKLSSGFPEALDFDDDSHYAALVRGYVRRMQLPEEVADRALRSAARDGKAPPEQIPGLLLGLSHLKPDMGRPDDILLDSASPNLGKLSKKPK